MTLHVVHDGEPLPLDRKKDGTPKKTLGNVLTVLAGDPQWHGVIAYDGFYETPVLLRPPPMRVQDAVDITPGTPWTPQDSTRAATWLDEAYGLPVQSSMVTEAMLAVAQKNTVHPVREFLDGLTWDGVARVEEFFATYCGVASSDYARGVARMLFVSAVARVRRPGSKVDTMIIFEGKQGIGKSRLLKVLAGDYFADTPIGLGDKDSFQQLRGVWIYELAELASFQGRDATRIKSFASSSTDHYRPSYEPRARSVPRQCIFIGTTNEQEYLADATGARRFWPVRLERIDLRAVSKDRAQLWAEADALYRGKTPWWPDAILDALGVEATSERFEGDPWEAPLRSWLAKPVRRKRLVTGGEDVENLDPAEGFTMADILTNALGLPTDRHDRRAQNRAGVVLRQAEWIRDANPRTTTSGRVRLWFPKGCAGDVPGGGAA